MSERFQQDGSVEAAPLEDEVIVVRPDVHEFCILNRTASVIWSQLEQPATAAEIAAEISTRFHGVPESEVLNDVEETLREMVERGLVTTA